MQKWQYQCTIISLIKVSYLHGYNWAINVLCTTKEVWSSFLSQFPTITVIIGLNPRGRNLPPGLSLPKSPAHLVAGAYLASDHLRAVTRRPCRVRSHQPSPRPRPRWRSERGDNHFRINSTEQRGSFYRHLVNPGQPNFRSSKAGRQPLSIQRAVWLAYNLGCGSEFITRFFIGRFRNMTKTLRFTC